LKSLDFIFMAALYFFTPANLYYPVIICCSLTGLEVRKAKNNYRTHKNKRNFFDSYFKLT